MRILIVGPFGTMQREDAIAKGFRLNGCDVFECSYGEYVFSNDIFLRLQLKSGIGPIYNKITAKVISDVKRVKPQFILFRRPQEFSRSMLQEIRNKTSARLASFNNDDPFSSVYHRNTWKKTLKAIDLFDIHFAFRRKNIKEYERCGAKLVSLWEPFYSPWIHRQLEKNDYYDQSSFKLLFAMHAEKDERREGLIALKAADIEVAIHSWNWNSVFSSSDSRRLEVKPYLLGDDYVSAIGKSAGVLCYFSKQNNDELTSRVFEIPACGGLLISKRTERQLDYFTDFENAIFFDSNEELIDKVKFLRDNPQIATSIRNEGILQIKRVRASIIDRCADAVKIFAQL